MNDLSTSAEEIAIDFLQKLNFTNLLSLAKTPGQENRWVEIVGYHHIVCLYWRAKIKNDINTLEKLNTTLGNKWYEEILLADVNCYQTLWKLIEKFYPYIGKLLVNISLIKPDIDPETKSKYQSMANDFALRNPGNLFAFIVETSINNGFYLCLKPYREVSIKKRIKALKSIQTAYINKNIKPHEQNSLKIFYAQFYPNEHLQIYLLIAQNFKKNNPEIEKLLDNYIKAQIRKGELMITGFSRSRSSKTFEKFRSFAWHDGNICFASSTGGVYSPPNQYVLVKSLVDFGSSLQLNNEQIRSLFPQV